MSARLPGLILLVLVTGVSIVHAQDQEAPGGDDVATAAESATLVVANRSIVTFRATVGGVEPAQRMRNARARIDAVKPAGLAQPVTSQAAQIGTLHGIIIAVGGQPVFGVVPEDLDPESLLTLDQLAARAAQQLRRALEAREQQRRVPVLLRGIGLSLLASLILAAVLRLILVGRERVRMILDRALRGRPLQIAGVDIRPTLETVERATFQVLSWSLIIASVYLWLTFVLQQFPYTAPLGSRLGDYLAARIAAAAAAAVGSLPNIILIVVVLLVTRAIALWVARLLAEIEHGVRVVKWLAQEQARATRRIAVTIIWLLGAATAYPLLPWARSIVFQGISVIVGIVVSLASTGMVNQWISGLVVLYSRSLRVGDFVRIGETEGIVTDMGALASKLRTVRGEEVTIPNAVLISDKLMNLTRLAEQQGGLLSTSINVGYDVPWQQVRALLLSAAEATKGVRRSPGPRVLQWELGEFSVEYHLHVSLERPLERAAMRSELNSRILDAFALAGVQIMTPHFESQPERRVLPPGPVPGDAQEPPVELRPSQ